MGQHADLLYRELDVHLTRSLRFQPQQLPTQLGSSVQPPSPATWLGGVTISPAINPTDMQIPVFCFDWTSFLV
jgi:hypothetical protein